MSEVEKLYKKAKVKPVCDGLDCFTCTAKCNNGKYPEFTAEKQLELIKWLARKDSYSCDYTEIKPRDNNEEWMSYSVYKAGFAHSFEESLAELINNLWQDLTEQDRTEIKQILEG